MGTQQQQLSADRLFEAAEACVSLAMSASERSGAVSPHPADMMDSPHPPAQLRGFEKWEVREATEFLFRLGIFFRTDAYRK